MLSVTISLKKSSGVSHVNRRTIGLLEVWDGRHTFIKPLFIDIIAKCIIKIISRDLIGVYVTIKFIAYLPLEMEFPVWKALLSPLAFRKPS